MPWCGMVSQQPGQVDRSKQLLLEFLLEGAIIQHLHRAALHVAQWLPHVHAQF
jgi:hypothetical protein